MSKNWRLWIGAGVTAATLYVDFQNDWALIKQLRTQLRRLST